MALSQERRNAGVRPTHFARTVRQNPSGKVCARAKRIRSACPELQRIHCAIRGASTYTSSSEVDRDSFGPDPHANDTEKFSALGHLVVSSSGGRQTNVA